MVQIGATAREGTDVPLLAHRTDLDRAEVGTTATAFAYEYDLVLDRRFGPKWTGWLMRALVTRLEAARATWGGARPGQVFASVSYRFGTAGGE